MHLIDREQSQLFACAPLTIADSHPESDHAVLPQLLIVIIENLIGRQHGYLLIRSDWVALVKRVRSFATQSLTIFNALGCWYDFKNNHVQSNHIQLRGETE
jgi:hypothetical protein